MDVDEKSGSRWWSPGLAGECVGFGLLVLVVLAAVLTVNGNSLAFSVAAGAVLGVAAGALRFSVQRRERGR